MVYLIGLCLLTLIGSTVFYLAHRVWRWIHHFVPALPLAVVLVIFVLLTVLMFLCVARPFGGALQQVISAIGACWMGIFVYLLLFFLLSDLVILVPRLFRLLSGASLDRFRLVAGITATVLALGVSVYGFCHARQLRTLEYEIQLSEAPSSQLRMAVISDVHLGAVGSESRLEKIVAEINALNPDLVCIAGDFFDSDFGAIADPEKAIALLRQINAPYGIYACLGNHDAGKTYSQMEAFLAQAGIHLLKDTYTVIDGRLILAGRLDPSPIGGYDGSRRQEMSAVLAGADPSLPVVVLDHNPASADTYRGDVGLVLSGHTHKGQIFPGNLITGAMYAVDHGYYKTAGGTQVLVTSGVGAWGLPMRVGTDCEILHVRLTF